MVTCLESLLNLASELMNCCLCGRTFPECKLSLTKSLVDTEIGLKVPQDKSLENLVNDWGKTNNPEWFAKFVIILTSLALGMATPFACYHCLGLIPRRREFFMMYLTGLRIIAQASITMSGLTLSGPGALFRWSSRTALSSLSSPRTLSTTEKSEGLWDLHSGVGGLTDEGISLDARNTSWLDLYTFL